MLLYGHEFDAPLSLHGVGKTRVIWYQVLFLPEHLAKRLPFAQYPRLRVTGEIADIPVSGAWMPTGDGRHYFIVSAAVRKDSGARLGDILPMRFAVDDQDRVDVPAALEDALNRRPDMRAIWEEITPGKRRGFAHQVAQAKTSATIRRRIDEVMDALSAWQSQRPARARRV